SIGTAAVLHAARIYSALGRRMFGAAIGRSDRNRWRCRKVEPRPRVQLVSGRADSDGVSCGVDRSEIPAGPIREGVISLGFGRQRFDEVRRLCDSTIALVSVTTPRVAIAASRA